MTPESQTLLPLGRQQATLREWIDRCVGAGSSASDIAAALALAGARRRSLPVDGSAPALVRRGLALGVPDAVEIDPWALGVAYEYALDPTHRHSQGIHYTPRSVASGLTALALGDDLDQRVCDPSVGGGAFLLAAAEHLESLGASPETVVTEQLWGIDIDPVAVEVAAGALALWGSRRGHWVHPGAHLCVADTLVEGAAAFREGAGGFEAVVGNPPFQGQLQSHTSRSPERSRVLRERWGVATGPYADTAVFFLLAATELVTPGGAIVLVQPQSVLVAGDACPAREELTTLCALEGLWIGDANTFEASVHVCAPVLRLGGPPPEQVQRWAGSEVLPEGPAESVEATSWGPLVAGFRGAPPVGALGEDVLGASCTATAGFRDQFYGLAPHTYDGVEGPDPALVTVGMIVPLRNRWGTDEFRFANRRWTHPRVNLLSLEAQDPTLARWVDQRRTPKLLIATQTKVVEVVVDEVGDLVPSTPVIALVPPVDRLWHVAALLSSPTIAAVAYSRVVGAALSTETIKLSARQVLELPLPTDSGAWDEGAHWARQAFASDREGPWRRALLRLAEVMCRAYGAPEADALMKWWTGRLPPWR